MYHLYNRKDIEVISRKDLPKNMCDSDIEDTFYKIYDKNSPIKSKLINVKKYYIRPWWETNYYILSGNYFKLNI